MSVTLRDYQRADIDAVRDAFRRGKRAPLLVAATGCHAAGQGVLMFDGARKEVQDVEVGDLLMGPDSAPRSVVGLIRGHGEMYRVNPVKGDPWTASRDHVLALAKTGTGELIDVPLSEWLGWTKTDKHLWKLSRTGVSFSGRSEHHAVDPYFVGVLLGDGCLTKGVAVSCPDPEIIEEVERQASAWGLRVRVGRAAKRSSDTRYITGGNGNPNPLLDAVKSLGLHGSRAGGKFIPDDYLFSSRDSRLELLAGVLDTDGSLSRRGYDFISKSWQLSEDVAFLARSLGFAAYVKQCQKGCQGGFSGTYYRVSISGDTNKIPCRVPRKKAQPRRQKKSVLRTGFSVEPISPCEYFGFTLSGDGRYLLDDFTITHNSGKTTTASEMIRQGVEKGTRISWLVHRRELVDQASSRLDDFGIDHGVVMRGHWRRRPNAPVQVCSIQTLVRRPEHDTDLYYIDEAHRALGNSYVEILNRNPRAKLVGLTATPCRTDGKGLGHLFDEIVLSLSPAELTDRGFLVPARVYAPSTPDLKGIKKTGGDYNSKQLAERVDRPTLVGDLVQHWVDLAKGRQTVCFATSIAHSKHIVERFVAAGIPAEHIDGETGLKEREAILNRIRSGETRIVSNVGVWTEGVDVPVMSCAILARPTASLALARQMIGRVLRPYTDKEEAILLDHAGVVLEHGFPTDDVEWSLDGKANRKARNVDDDGLSVWRCKECFRMFYATTRECPECGHVEQPPVRQIEETDGRLVEVKPGAYRAPAVLSSNPQIAECQKIAEFMGYKPGWVQRQAWRISRGLKPQIPERARSMEALVGS